jgi:hypothetical protein
VIPVSVVPCACERNDWQRCPGDGGTIIACRQCGDIGAITRDPGGSNAALAGDPESPSLHKVTLTLCSLCLLGEGGQCHTPGCALWLKAAPDLPLRLEPEQQGEGS